MDRLTYVIRKRSGTAEPGRWLVSVVNRPQLRINLDLYHTQIGEGDLIRWCEACLPWICEVQVADNPGRCDLAQARSTIAA